MISCLVSFGGPRRVAEYTFDLQTSVETGVWYGVHCTWYNFTACNACILLYDVQPSSQLFLFPGVGRPPTEKHPRRTLVSHVFLRWPSCTCFFFFFALFSFFFLIPSSSSQLSFFFCSSYIHSFLPSSQLSFFFLAPFLFTLFFFFCSSSQLSFFFFAPFSFFFSFLPRRVDPTSEEDSYDDVVCVLQLLSHLVTKDLVDQSDEPTSEKVNRSFLFFVFYF